MIEVGEFYADESLSGASLLVKSITCASHGAVPSARMVLGVELSAYNPLHAHVLLCCPYCIRTVTVVLERLAGLPPSKRALADMPITSEPEGA